MKAQKLIIVVLLIIMVLVIVIGERNFGNYEFSQEDVQSTELQEKVSAEPSTFKEKLEAGEEVTIVFLGDSTTEQNETTAGDINHVGLLDNWFEEEYPEQVEVINSGVSGNTITQMKDRLSTDVLRFAPDLVIISSGLNDALGSLRISLEEFEESYSSIIASVKEKEGVEVVVRTPNLTLNPAFNDSMVPYLKSTKEIAQAQNVQLFDFYEKMADDIQLNAINHSDLMKDTIHPNAQGQRYIFQNFQSFLESGVIKN